MKPLWFELREEQNREIYLPSECKVLQAISQELYYTNGLPMRDRAALDDWRRCLLLRKLSYLPMNCHVQIVQAVSRTQARHWFSLVQASWRLVWAQALNVYFEGQWPLCIIFPKYTLNYYILNPNRLQIFLRKPQVTPVLTTMISQLSPSVQSQFIGITELLKANSSRVFTL